MGQADCRFRLIDVLPAGALRPHGIDLHIGLVDIDDDAVVHHRIDRQAGKRCVTARIGVERRNPHQPVHARFGLKPPVGIMPLDLNGRRLDARFFATGLFEILDLEVVLLCPARIHPQQNVRPVLAFGTAGARVNFHIGVAGICFTRKQRFRFAPADFRLQLA